MAMVINKIAQVSRPISPISPITKPRHLLPVTVFVIAAIATMLIFISL